MIPLLLTASLALDALAGVATSGKVGVEAGVGV